MPGCVSARRSQCRPDQPALSVPDIRRDAACGCQMRGMSAFVRSGGVTRYWGLFTILRRGPLPSASLDTIPRRTDGTLNNLTIAPKLGIVVGLAMLGLCTAGVLAGHLMQREMLNARIDQTKAIVDMARNMAAGLMKEVEAGKLTKEAA